MVTPYHSRPPICFQFREAIQTPLELCKQIGLCITLLCKRTVNLGIIVYVNSNMYVFDLILGAGVMLSATEVPRILQQFGLDTSMKANVSQAIYGASGIMNIASVFMR